MLSPRTLRRSIWRAYPNIDRAIAIKTFQVTWRNPDYRIGHVIDTNVITMAN
jgi:predicted secreted Zn-dependent protease